MHTHKKTNRICARIIYIKIVNFLVIVITLVTIIKTNKCIKQKYITHISRYVFEQQKFVRVVHFHGARCNFDWWETNFDDLCDLFFRVLG